MALGDGDTWDETAPTDSTVAIQIDDYMRHIVKGVRSRMAFEHEWPASQSATSEAGKHKHVTLQMKSGSQTALITGTQLGAVYMKTFGTTGASLCFMNSATQEVQVSKKSYVWYMDGNAATGTNLSAKFYVISDGSMRGAYAYCATTASGGAGIQVDINYDGTSIWTATANQLILAPGSTSTNVTTFVQTVVTQGGVLTVDVDKVGTGTAGGGITIMLEIG